MRKIFYALLMNLCLLTAVEAQDIHFTQFNMQPVLLNPAYSGAFLGSLRVGAIYRSQWAKVADKKFATQTLYADVPLIRGARKQDWIGVGISYYDDKAGALDLKNSAFHLSLAYHLAFNKKQTSVLTFGVQYGSISRSVSTQYIDELSLIPGSIGEDELLLSLNNSVGAEGPSASLTDINAGVLLRSELNEGMNFSLGFSAAHITTPLRNAFGPNDATVTVRDTSNFTQDISILSTLHGEFNAQLTDKLDMTPAFIARFFGPSSEYAFQTIFGYQLPQENMDLKARAGLGYRLTGGDAVELFAGADFNDWRVMLSYDINTSALSTVSNSQGAFEIAVQKIFSFYKKPTPTPVFLCPKYY